MKNNIKEIREKKGIKQNVLAVLSGLSSTAIYYYENGDREPTLESAYKLAAVLEVSVYELWEDETKIEEQTTTVRRVIA